MACASTRTCLFDCSCVVVHTRTTRAHSHTHTHTLIKSWPRGVARPHHTAAAKRAPPQCADAVRQLCKSCSTNSFVCLVSLRKARDPLSALPPMHLQTSIFLCAFFSCIYLFVYVFVCSFCLFVVCLYFCFYNYFNFTLIFFTARNRFFCFILLRILFQTRT